MEHALALDLRQDHANAAYYEEDPSNKPFFRLTKAGRQFFTFGERQTSGDSVDACLSDIESRLGPPKKGLAKRALVILRESFRQKKSETLNEMESWGCDVDSPDPVTRCWMKQNCPDIQP